MITPHPPLARRAPETRLLSVIDLNLWGNYFPRDFVCLFFLIFLSDTRGYHTERRRDWFRRRARPSAEASRLRGCSRAPDNSPPRPLSGSSPFTHLKSFPQIDHKASKTFLILWLIFYAVKSYTHTRLSRELSEPSDSQPPDPSLMEVPPMWARKRFFYNIYVY